MSNNNTRRGNKKEEDDTNWLGIVAGVAALGAVVAGGAYALNKFLDSKEEERVRSSSPVRSNSYVVPHRSNSTSYNSWNQGASSYVRDDPLSRNPEFHKLRLQDPSTPNVVISVDATPTRGGGILIRQYSKAVYYYSLDWSNYLQFPDQSDKFETANAFIAMKLFENYVTCGGPIDIFQIKVDNKKFERRKRMPERPNEDDVFWEKVNAMKSTLHRDAEWDYTIASEDDIFHHADYLSRGKMHYISDLYPQYDHFKWNVEAQRTLLQCLDDIPEKYHKINC